MILEHFSKADPLIFALLEKMPERLLGVHSKPEEYFYRLCLDIIGQQLSVKAADTIARRFEALLQGKITPAHILSFTDEELRSVGLSNAKVKYVKDLATKVKDGSLQLEKLPNLNNEEVIAQLTQVKGIGRWTAEMFLLFTLGREDVFSHGDLGLKNAYTKLYQLAEWDTTLAAEQVQKWHPYQSYGSLALWYSLEITPNPKKNRS